MCSQKLNQASWKESGPQKIELSFDGFSQFDGGGQSGLFKFICRAFVFHKHEFIYSQIGWKRRSELFIFI